MSIQVKKLQAALKHGAYSATALLPGAGSGCFQGIAPQDHFWNGRSEEASISI